MNRGVLVLMFVFLVASRVGIAQSEPSQSPSSDEVILDGAKNPEQFPEWFIWEHTFQWLDADHTNRRVPLYQELGISEPELKVLQGEVRVFKQLQAKLARELKEARDAASAQRKSEDQIRDATQAVNLAYRYKILEGRQRVYEQLPPESLLRLRRWINQLIASTQVHLRGRAVRFFKEPW